MMNWFVKKVLKNPKAMYFIVSFVIHAVGALWDRQITNEEKKELEKMLSDYIKSEL